MNELIASFQLTHAHLFQLVDPPFAYGVLPPQLITITSAVDKKKGKKANQKLLCPLFLSKPETLYVLPELKPDFEANDVPRAKGASAGAGPGTPGLSTAAAPNVAEQADPPAAGIAAAAPAPGAALARRELPLAMASPAGSSSAFTKFATRLEDLLGYRNQGILSPAEYEVEVAKVRTTCASNPSGARPDLPSRPRARARWRDDRGFAR
ncbi:hypothetical protein KFE25_008479 [Diacronema lutheri]|uniref:Uncharacterized protein n=1 Tax=Diacronema lutheri TaxID=2081491 RepID=A0A8J5X8X8_DIALT|nr:hypothetical protein KFE25_008479 [Diacronema lutheri]